MDFALEVSFPDILIRARTDYLTNDNIENISTYDKVVRCLGEKLFLKFNNGVVDVLGIILNRPDWLDSISCLTFEPMILKYVGPSLFITIVLPLLSGGNFRLLLQAIKGHYANFIDLIERNIEASLPPSFFSLTLEEHKIIEAASETVREERNLQEQRSQEENTMIEEEQNELDIWTLQDNR